MNHEPTDRPSGQERDQGSKDQERFMQSLASFAKDHRAVHWSGRLTEFLEKILPHDPQGAARTSHQYMWDMIRWMREEDEEGNFSNKLFDQELFGVDEAI